MCLRRYIFYIHDNFTFLHPRIIPQFQISCDKECMSGLRSSQNHQWLTSDMLGQGATGGVYRGWRIDTGASVAVKTFNTVGLQRPSHVHNREFDILRAISHPNIVQMFAVEEEERSKESVIVMELCTGGSLYNVLEEPEYIYGLREEHLLKLISDVTNGMSYLREKVSSGPYS